MYTYYVIIFFKEKVNEEVLETIKQYINCNMHNELVREFSCYTGLLSGKLIVRFTVDCNANDTTRLSDFIDNKRIIEGHHIIRPLDADIYDSS